MVTASAKQRIAWKAAIDKALEPANPCKGLFHASEIKSMENGFVQLKYDLSKAEQMQDFGCQIGQLRLEEKWLTVPKGTGEWAQARLKASLLEVKLLDVKGRTLIAAPRFGI